VTYATEILQIFTNWTNR